MTAPRYEMGLSFGGVAIPDPAKWNFSIESLDASAERDGTGLLHRDMVAEKINFSYEFHALSWEQMSIILNAVRQPEFTAVTPDPYTPRGTRSGSYYVGGRNGDTIYFWPNTEEVGLFNLSFNIIQY